MQVRLRGFAAAHLAGSERALGPEHRSAAAGLDHHRLVPGRMAWGGHETHTFGDLVVTVHLSKARCRDRRPLRDGVPRPLGVAAFGRLHEHRGVEESLLPAMVEVKMREDDSSDVSGLEPDGAERFPKGRDLWRVPLVDHLVVLADAGVDEDGAGGMTDDPRMNRERLERTVLGVPIGHGRHTGEYETLDLGQRRQRHGATVDQTNVPSAGRQSGET